MNFSDIHKLRALCALFPFPRGKGIIHLTQGAEAAYDSAISEAAGAAAVHDPQTKSASKGDIYVTGCRL
jgi:hypothetical protein